MPEKKVLDEVKYKQLVALRLQHVPATQIAKKLNISVHQVQRVIASDEFKSELSMHADLSIMNARNILKANAEAVLQDVWIALNKLIKSERGRDAADE